MAKKLQLRRGTILEHNTFTGALGELTMVIDDNSLRVHDGATLGGHSIATETFVTNQGYLTSYTETDPIYTASSWYTTTNNSSNWNTAYSWGNHASVGYALSTDVETVNGNALAYAIALG